MTELIECVPNFSEGVNKEVIAAIANRVRDSSDVRVLGIEPDPDYNRTVLTFAGSPEGVFAGACEVMRASSELIDMREHQGEQDRPQCQLRSNSRTGSRQRDGGIRGQVRRRSESDQRAG